MRALAPRRALVSAGASFLLLRVYLKKNVHGLTPLYKQLRLHLKVWGRRTPGGVLHGFMPHGKGKLSVLVDRKLRVVGR